MRSHEDKFAPFFQILVCLITRRAVVLILTFPSRWGFQQASQEGHRFLSNSLVGAKTPIREPISGANKWSQWSQWTHNGHIVEQCVTEWHSETTLKKEPKWKHVTLWLHRLHLLAP